MQFPLKSAVEIFHSGRWHVAGELRVLDRARGVFTYADDYAFSESPLPVSLRLPVSIEPPPLIDGLLGKERDLRLPAFLYDLVPQGRGRQYLLNKLNLNDSDGLEAALILHGAFCPIGALRLSSAVNFYQEEARNAAGEAAPYMEGFTLEDMAAKSEAFVEHLALHSMLASGTTGVQGVAPKFLLATNEDGQWFSDMTLPDAVAKKHWLAKLPRGRAVDDLVVHRNEAAYLRLAHACGIRTNEPPQVIGDILLVRRFDREVRGGALHRLHQESAASLCGLRGFGLAARQQDLLQSIRQVVDDPLQETIEFMRRDALNMAMRNTDNHARNTAVQRTIDGVVQLTPLFDFAPKFRDPELIARTCHWKSEAGQRLPDWAAVIQTLEVDDAERERLAAAMADFGQVVEQLPALARDAGVDDEIIEQCQRSIEAQAQQLSALNPMREAHRG